MKTKQRMTQEDVISIAKAALEKEGYDFFPEPDYIECMPVEALNKHLTAMQVESPYWLLTFPLRTPNDFRSHAGISVNDQTGVTMAPGLS